MNNINPFETILGQMNQAKVNYDATMQGLQQQLASARQAASAMYQNPFLPQQIPPAQATVPQSIPGAETTPAPEAPGVPAHLQIISAIGDLKEVIEKRDEHQGQTIDRLCETINEMVVKLSGNQQKLGFDKTNGGGNGKS